MRLVQVNDTCKTMRNLVAISSNEMPGNIWFKWASVIRPSPDSSSFVKTFSSFSTYSASKSTKTRIKLLHWADVVQGQARESTLKAFKPFQIQDHYSTTEYSQPIRLLDQVAPLQHEQCCFVPFRSVVTYSCMCLLLQTFNDLMLGITLSCIKGVLSVWCGTKVCCPYTHTLDILN